MGLRPAGRPGPTPARVGHSRQSRRRATPHHCRVQRVPQRLDCRGGGQRAGKSSLARAPWSPSRQARRRRHRTRKRRKGKRRKGRRRRRKRRRRRRKTAAEAGRPGSSATTGADWAVAFRAERWPVGLDHAAGRQDGISLRAPQLVAPAPPVPTAVGVHEEALSAEATQARSAVPFAP